MVENNKAPKPPDTAQRIESSLVDGKVGDAAQQLRSAYQQLGTNPKEFNKVVNEMLGYEAARGQSPNFSVQRDASGNVASIDFSEKAAPTSGASSDPLYKDQTAVLFDRATANDNNKFLDFKGVANETTFRNELAESSGQAIVQTAFGKPGEYRALLMTDDLDRNLVAHDPFTPATNKTQKIAQDVATIFEKGEQSASLNQAKLWADLPDSVQKATHNPPMAAHEQTYTDKVTHDEEKQLIDKLSATTGPIKYTDLANYAMEICHNDTGKAMLTLANFSKNLASVERRQIQVSGLPANFWQAPDKTDPSKMIKTAAGNMGPDVVDMNPDHSYQDMYTVSKMDSIAARIEPLADSPDAKVSKEGSMYHFFSAAYAGYETAMVDNAIPLAVRYENLRYGHESVEFGAGIAGAEMGRAVARSQSMVDRALDPLGPLE